MTLPSKYAICLILPTAINRFNTLGMGYTPVSTNVRGLAYAKTSEGLLDKAVLLWRFHSVFQRSWLFFPDFPALTQVWQYSSRLSNRLKGVRICR